MFKGCLIGIAIIVAYPVALITFVIANHLALTLTVAGGIILVIVATKRR